MEKETKCNIELCRRSLNILKTSRQKRKNRKNKIKNTFLHEELSQRQNENLNHEEKQNNVASNLTSLCLRVKYTEKNTFHPAEIFIILYEIIL